MGTSCRIGLLKDNQVKCVYCHHDGYTSYAGVILLHYYSNEEKLEALLDKGNVASLGIKVNNTTFYEDEEPSTVSASDFMKEPYYHYLYDAENKKWLLFHEDHAFVKLEDVLSDAGLFAEIEGHHLDTEKEFLSIKDLLAKCDANEQSWYYDHMRICSIINLQAGVVDVYHIRGFYDENKEYKYDVIHLYIPCSSLVHGEKISDEIWGKSFDDIRKEYGLFRIREGA